VLTRVEGCADVVRHTPDHFETVADVVLEAMTRIASTEAASSQPTAGGG
jgi:hypothetical protein